MRQIFDKLSTRRSAKAVRDTAGFSLLEIMVAASVFLVVLGVAAQALVSHHAAMRIQEQRLAAANNCRALLAEMRAFRDASVDDFPGDLVSQYPNNAVIDAEDGQDIVTLPGEEITITYVDPNANPLQVVLTSRWNDSGGRRASFIMSTMLTGE